MGLESFGKGSWFQLKLVCCFQMLLKTFLYTSRKCSRYLKRTPDPNRYVSQKIRANHHTNFQISVTNATYSPPPSAIFRQN